MQCGGTAYKLAGDTCTALVVRKQPPTFTPADLYALTQSHTDVEILDAQLNTFPSLLAALFPASKLRMLTSLPFVKMVPKIAI